MKLHEEFKEYENLWEAKDGDTTRYGEPFLKTFGKAQYNLADPNELMDWVNANLDFQTRRHPDRYASTTVGSLYNRQKLTNNVFKNLRDTLRKENANAEILTALEAIWSRTNRYLKSEGAGSDDSTRSKQYIADNAADECIDSFIEKLKEESYSVELNLKRDASVRSRLRTAAQLLADIAIQLVDDSPSSYGM